MKIRLLIMTFAICVIATPVMADMYQLDAATADDMRLIYWTDDATLNYVGYNTGFDLIPPTNLYGSTTNILTVCFTGNIADTDGAGIADAYIGLNYTIDLSKYDEGFLLPIANDNGDTWQYKAYVTAGTDVTTNTVESTSWLTLDQDSAGAVWVGYDSSAFTQSSSLGFMIRWDQSIPANLNKTGDQFATSVVPVPAAVILGMLGLGVAGLKLRKFA